MADSNYYELLGLDPSATENEIRAAYIRFSKVVHPDRGGNEALFRQVNSAYETLSDPVLREEYDRNGYVDHSAKSSKQSAPGWRRTDDKPPKRPGPKTEPKANPTSSSEDEETSGPPPPSSPPPPPQSHEAAGRGRKGGDRVNSIQRRAAANPSWALFAVGILLLAVAHNFGGATPLLLLLGFSAAIVGFVGVLGRKKAARGAAMMRADIVAIDLMTGAEFEERLRVAFEHVGYTVYHVGGRGDFGADLVLDLPGTRTVVQAKRWSQSVGPSAVQEVVASRAHYGADHAIVVTSSSYTAAALELAESNGVEMWDRSRLIEFLAAQEIGPTPKGGALLAEELKAGAPTALKGAFVVFVGLLGAAAAGSKSGRKRRRKPKRRW